MIIGIFGLPASGKTLLFSLLTGTKLDPNVFHKDGMTATALVHDARVDALAAIFNPKKITYASLTFSDLPGFDLGASQNEKVRVMQFIQNSDALLCVVRAFASHAVPWPADCQTPARQLETIRTELLLRDLAIVENRLERIAETEHRRHKLTEDEQRERKVLTAVKAGLEAERLVSQQEIDPRDQKAAGTLGLFTAKPVIVVVNTDEAQFQQQSYPDQEFVRQECAKNGFAYLELPAKIETEINQLEEADRQVFLDEYGIHATGIQSLSAVAYRHVGLISFLTVGEDEVRAWTIKAGTNAKEAAGAIHTSLSKNFIKAEVIPYETFMTLKDMKAAKAQNLVRLVGKEEIVQDGDIITVRAGA